METETAVKILTRMLSRVFYNDPSSPSLVLSWLPREKMFYGALVRFKEAYGKGRETIATTEHSELAEVLRVLSKAVPQPPSKPKYEYDANVKDVPSDIDDDIPF